MLLQPVLQGSPSLPNVHLWAFRAGNRVDYSLSLIHWHSVLWVNQELAKGHQRAKHHLDVQWCEDSSDSFREVADVRQSQSGFRSLLLSVWPWSAGARVLVDTYRHPSHAECISICHLCMRFCPVDTCTPLSHGHATRFIPEFWHSHGHVNLGSIRVEPGLNPGSRPCLRAGFRPGSATR